MNKVGTPERATQNRVIALFRDQLGYRMLGDWTDRLGNSNIEEDLLSAYLKRAGYQAAQIKRAIYLLRVEADNPNRGLYDNNKAVYSLLRYGVPVKIEAGRVTELVKVFDWANPLANDFAVAEEVTLHGNHERRPDLVLYVNGIAVGVIELKNSRVSIGDGIRQNLSNQQAEFNQWFFSTVQFVFAGNDSEGLQYGSIGTEEKFFLKWKEDELENSGFKLDKYLVKMCAKQRLMELMHDFVLFDGGTKKLPRAHQYFGIKAAQTFVDAYKGGIIWHTQGSGKSIVMVLLAKWILENKPKARVVIVTDRDELDKQIETVFTEAGEAIKRTSSGRDLMNQLGQATPRLLCSLVHKFGQRGVDNFEAFIKELAAQPCKTVGYGFRLRSPSYGGQVACRTLRFCRYSTPRKNLFDFGRPPARRPASARLPRQSANSFQLMLCSRPAESFHVRPALESNTATSDNLALEYFCRRTPRPRAISGT